jgi:hypothetical protein
LEHLDRRGSGRPGAEPIRPPILGADDSRVHVLRNVFDMDRIIGPP